MAEKNNTSGYGVKEYDNVATYEGNLYNGDINGQGIFTLENGDVYDGVWSSRDDGVGKITYVTGDVYEGTWSGYRRARNGEGTMTYSDGDQYTGSWQDGYRHGVGHMTYCEGDRIINGSRYIKESRDDETGQVTEAHTRYSFFKSEIGDQYRGEWAYGSRSGQGVMTFADGCVQEGIWSQDVFGGAKSKALKRKSRNTFFKGLLTDPHWVIFGVILFVTAQCAILAPLFW